MCSTLAMKVIYKPTALLLGLLVAFATEGLCLLIQLKHEFAPELPLDLAVRTYHPFQNHYTHEFIIFIFCS